MSDKTNDSAKPDISEISAAASHDLYQQFMANVVLNPDQVIQRESGGLGLKLYAEMEQKDGHIKAVLQIRILALTAREWGVDPASDAPEDVAKADFVRENFKRLSWAAVVGKQMDAILKGYAVSEIIWEMRGGKARIAAVKHRRPWRFVFGPRNELRMTTPSQPIEGEPLPDRKFWVWSFDEKYGNRYGNGLGGALYWPYFFKKNNLKFWALFNDKFGSPTVIGKYPPGTPKDKQDLLLEVIGSIQQETGIRIPQDMQIELLEAERRGTFETYERFVGWCEEIQSKIVLGQTLTTQHGKTGSLSLGEVHERVRIDIRESDGNAICESLNSGPVKWLIDYNWPPSDVYPKVWIRSGEEKNLQARAQIDKAISEMGWRPTQEYIEETYDVTVEAVPVQVSGVRDQLSGIRGQGSADPCPHCADFADKSATLNEDAPDTQDKITQRLLKEAGLEAFINPVAGLLDESTSFEDFQSRLLDVYKNMNPVELGNLLQRALTVAELAGRYEAQRGE